ncbi:MAG: phosphomannomutase/phosphoglucomutase [Patescibacteria group bacterium]
MKKEIFKAYDIRGIYPTEIDEADAYAIGRAVVLHLSPSVVGVGRDVRASSPSLFENFTRGLMDGGADVIDLGIITTPMVYFAAGRLDIDVAISITASHNPPQYNGMKIALRGALPVGEHTGLSDIRDIALAEDFPPIESKGSLKTEDIKPAYYGYFASFADFDNSHFSLVIDTANAMGVYELPIYEQFPEQLSLTYLYNDIEKAFDCHEANPLNVETLVELQAEVVATGAHLGIAYDGDADRIGFVDELGEVIPMDLITGLLARTILEKHPGATILYDLRSSRAVKEVIEENGGVAMECKVGHANIKRQMRGTGAIFAGELSGHYYFEENSSAEAGTLPALLLLNLMAETGKPMSELVAEIKRYYHSGEINSEVAEKDRVLQELKEKYADGAQHELDGLKVSYPTWWFNVRASNTEPLLRLNLEAETPELLAEKTAELLAIIRS